MLAPPRAPLPLSGPTIAAALAHAQTGRPALVTAEAPAPMPTSLPTDTRAVIWRTVDGVQWVGLGEACHFAAERGDDAADAAARCQALLREGVFGAPEACRALRGFGGLAFDPADERPAPLSVSAPVAAFWVPELLYSGETSHVLVSVPVEASDDEAAVQQRWNAARSRAELPGSSAPHAAFTVAPADPAPWMGAVSAALETIRDGGLGKVVLARAIALQAPAPADPQALWSRLADGAPQTHRFLFRFPDGAAFLGASPERLFALEGRALRLDGLAGTVRRDADPERDAAFGAELLANDKDLREHAFVVRAIAEALAPWAEHLSYPETPALKRLPTVQHLHTPITGTLRPEVGLETLLTALHPTPAVGGTPREAAIAAIRDLEPLGRGWYAGPVGWISAEGAEFAVAIRSAYMAGTQAAVMAGAGIVAGSTPEGEWDETARKAAPLVRLLTEDRA